MSETIDKGEAASHRTAWAAAVARWAEGRRVVVAGGGGFLGRVVVEWLDRAGVEAVVLTRRPKAFDGPARAVAWDGRRLGDWTMSLRDAAGLVNLAGRTVDCVKTPDRRDEILRSRVESTRVLGQACRAIAESGGQPPAVWVQMSTAHIYGDPPAAVCDESSAFGTGLAPEVGRAWEAALEESVQPSQREVRLRTSFVIGRDRGAGGGALATLAKLARFGLGGRVGSGRQGFSWIHEDDFAAIVAAALTGSVSPDGAVGADGAAGAAGAAEGEPKGEPMRGAYIVSGPQPVSQAEFMAAVRRAVGMPIGLPTPAWAVRLGTPLVMRTDPELALYGRYVMPQRLLDAGFAFEFPELQPALDNLLRVDE